MWVASCKLESVLGRAECNLITTAGGCVSSRFGGFAVRVIEAEVALEGGLWCECESNENGVN